MKKSEMYKSIIKDVICASGIDITDEYFEKLVMLFDEYRFSKECEVEEGDE